MSKPWDNGERIKLAASMLPESEQRSLSQTLSNWLLQERVICEGKKKEADRLNAIIERQASALSSTLRRLERKVAQMEKRVNESEVLETMRAVKRVNDRCTKLDKDLTAMCKELSNLSEEWQHEFNTVSKRMGKTYTQARLWQEALAYASKKLK